MKKSDSIFAEELLTAASPSSKSSMNAPCIDQSVQCVGAQSEIHREATNAIAALPTFILGDSCLPASPYRIHIMQHAGFRLNCALVLLASAIYLTGPAIAQVAGWHPDPGDARGDTDGHPADEGSSGLLMKDYVTV